MKIRAGGGNFRAAGGDLGQQGAPPCYSSLWETLVNVLTDVIFQTRTHMTLLTSI